MDFSQIQWDIRGKVCLITGGNSGIGRETALELIKRGAAKIIIACRNLETGDEAIKYIRREANLINDVDANQRLVLRKLDLGSLESVRQCAEQINDEERVLHIIICNAGVYAPSDKTLTADGFEMSFGTNHLGHFLLAKLLVPLMKRSAPARVIVVASVAYKFCVVQGGFHIEDPNYENSFYEAWMAYSQSKLANILFARTLDQKLNEGGASGVTVYSLHPGAVKTNLLLRNRSKVMQFLVSPLRFFFCTPQEGAKTSIYCATQSGIEQYSGQYFSDSQLAETWAIAHDDEMALKLWNASEQMIEGKY